MVCVYVAKYRNHLKVSKFFLDYVMVSQVRRTVVPDGDAVTSWQRGGLEPVVIPSPPPPPFALVRRTSTSTLIHARCFYPKTLCEPFRLQMARAYCRRDQELSGGHTFI